MSLVHELLPFDITCPYCWETINITVDGSVPEQQYIEDCQVCCNPIELVVMFDAGGKPSVTARNPEE